MRARMGGYGGAAAGAGAAKGGGGEGSDGRTGCEADSALMRCEAHHVGARDVASMLVAQRQFQRMSS